MSRAIRPAVAAVLAATPGAPGQDDIAPAELERPGYTFLRYREDWSVLRDADPSRLTDFWDPIKYVPLNEDGSIWASFGGSTRMRLESWSNFDFKPGSANDDTFVLWRALLHGDLHLGDNVRAFMQGKSAFASNRTLPGGKRPVDVDNIDLELAFADFTLPLGDDLSLTARAGRQTFLFGKQRLVSPLPWANTLRRWDGVSGILDWGGWNVRGFWSRFVPVKKYRFNDSDNRTQFFGVYATGPLGLEGVKLDIYFLGLDEDDPVTFNGTTGPQERYTFGGRLFGPVGASGFDYDFEGAYQLGEVGSGDVDAFMIGSQLGYRPAGAWASPRFFVGFDFGSGDRTPGGDVETFDQLFPLGHAYYGYADVVGRQNAIDLSLGLTFDPLDKLSVYVAGHFLWRDERDDALYNASGAVVRSGGLGGSSELGQEIDVVLKYRLSRHLVAEAGWSHFFPGSFIEESGSSKDLNFTYIQLEYTF